VGLLDISDMNLYNASDREFILKLREIILGNLENENFGVAELILATGVNHSNIYRRVKSITGKSVSQFIREIRLREAMAMLQRNEATVAEISYKVGFGSPAYFNTCFHEYFGFPPGDVKRRSMHETDPDPAAGSDPVDEMMSSRGKLKSLKFTIIKLTGVWLIVVFIFVVAPGMYFFFNSAGKGAYHRAFLNLFQQGEKSIAVLPFKSLSADANNGFFSEGILDDIMNELFLFNNLRVISRTSVEQFRDTKGSVREVGKKLKVDYILEGSVQNDGKNVRVIAKLIDVRKDQQVWSGKYDKNMTDMLVTQSSISGQITCELESVLASGEKYKAERVRSKNPEAYNFYLKGRYFLCRRTRADSFLGIEYFEKSIASDPGNALAYSGLADTYFNQAMWGWLPADKGFAKAKEMAKFAIALDKTVAEAHATLGGILTWREWKWKEAQQELLTALALNPNCATAHYYYSELLEVSNNKDEAREHLDYAIDLDPLYFWYYLVSSTYHYFDGRLEESLKACQEAELIRPGFEGVYGQYFQIFRKQGEDAMAASAFQQFLHYHSDSTFRKWENNVREIYGRQGINGLLTCKIQLESDRSKSLPLSLALDYNNLGHFELALTCLEDACGRHTNDVPWINVNPDFDNLRLNPRFQELIRRMGLASFTP
jgi:TolB-like protein/AraC-like DNA-binding protein